MPDPFRRRKLRYESGLEAAWLTVLIAHPDVFDIKEQQRVDFLHRGVMTYSVFDFVYDSVCGRRIAGAVKYLSDVDEALKATLGSAADYAGDTFADDWKIFSEEGLSRTRIRNAGRIISCAGDFDFEAQDALAEVLADFGPEIRVADCDLILGDGQRGSRAAMALIQTGNLVIPKGERLGRETVLRNLFTK